MTRADDGRLATQITYYRERAAEYDEDAYSAEDDPTRYAADLLDPLPVAGDVLELACGTGQWTGLLAARATKLTALDASQEMIEIARRRNPGEVEWIVADLFDWSDDRRFDTVFFAFWLSHVPWDLWPAFWSRIAELVAPGGSVVVIDETAEGIEDVEEWAGPDTSRRHLADGRGFEIVKLRLDPPAVAARLAELGWSARPRLAPARFFSLAAARSGMIGS